MRPLVFCLNSSVRKLNVQWREQWDDNFEDNYFLCIDVSFVSLSCCISYVCILDFYLSSCI